ncbi:MAG: protoglobin family protein [Pirellulaceae bacterium]|nr:protoglobin family protein [Planctomycetales bacterium]
MKSVDEARLESDLQYRYDYLAEFIGFTEDDVRRIHGLAARLTPRIPAMVDGTYRQLLSFDATARHFLPRQFGFEGQLPDGLAALGQDAEQIQFRKEHLRRYLQALVGNPYDARMVKYLNVVGKMHTPQSGNKQIDVPLVQMNALMGLLSDTLTETIFDLELDKNEERSTVRAFQKLMWIQNDFINRHYQSASPQPTPSSPDTPPAASAWR